MRKEFGGHDEKPAGWRWRLSPASTAPRSSTPSPANQRSRSPRARPSSPSCPSSGCSVRRCATGARLPRPARWARGRPRRTHHRPAAAGAVGQPARRRRLPGRRAGGRPRRTPPACTVDGNGLPMHGTLVGRAGWTIVSVPHPGRLGRTRGPVRRRRRPRGHGVVPVPPHPLRRPHRHPGPGHRGHHADGVGSAVRARELRVAPVLPHPRRRPRPPEGRAAGPAPPGARRTAAPDRGGGRRAGRGRAPGGTDLRRRLPAGPGPPDACCPGDGAG